MSGHYYFAYGSNMNPTRVEKRKMGYSVCESGILSGYRLAFNKRSVKYPGAAAANIVEAEGNQVEGVVYHLNDERQINVMDPFEGYPVRYTRLVVPIKTTTEIINVWAYVANPEYLQEGLKPATWYLNHLLSAKEFLSNDYFEQLAMTVCLQDSEVEPNS
jgi:gamma-glutamylcyclotransferase (GGCT)/AIG2-like uncharacterized protein YtfP